MSLTAKAQEAFLKSIKRHEGVITAPARRGIARLVSRYNRPIDSAPLQWDYRSGQGGDETDLMDMGAADLEVADSLVESGHIVPTFTRSIDPDQEAQDYIHFDDVLWGKRQDGSIVIYSLPFDEDLYRAVLTLDGRHQKALTELGSRIDRAKTLLDKSPVLVAGEVIVPILTDAHSRRMRAAQIAYENGPAQG